jgi:hypothetical protein
MVSFICGEMNRVIHLRKLPTLASPAIDRIPGTLRRAR